MESEVTLILDPCSEVLASQDFRHTVQGDNEAMPNFICHLERSLVDAVPLTRKILIREITNEGQHDTDEGNNLDLSLLCSDSKGTVDTLMVSDKGSTP